MSRSFHSFFWLRISLLWLVTGLPLAKAIEPPLALPVLVQLESQALVPFYLEQKQAGLGNAALDQAVQRQAKRIAGEQDTLAKRLKGKRPAAAVISRFSSRFIVRRSPGAESSYPRRCRMPWIK